MRGHHSNLQRPSGPVLLITMVLAALGLLVLTPGFTGHAGASDEYSTTSHDDDRCEDRRSRDRCRPTTTTTAPTTTTTSTTVPPTTTTVAPPPTTAPPPPTTAPPPPPTTGGTSTARRARVQPPATTASPTTATSAVAPAAAPTTAAPTTAAPTTATTQADDADTGDRPMLASSNRPPSGGGSGDAVVWIVAVLIGLGVFAAIIRLDRRWSDG